MATDKKKNVLSMVGPVLMATGCVAVAAAGAAMSGGASSGGGDDTLDARTASFDPTDAQLRG